jgi:Ca2+-binding EF-hand superfamily protein
MDQIAMTYDCSVHPEVRSGEKQEQQILREMMNGWDTNSDGLVSESEFFDFYSYNSAAFEKDDDFVGVMRTAWML